MRTTAIAAALLLALAGCGSGAAGISAVRTPPPTAPAAHTTPSPPPAASPVSTTATVTGKCVTGTEDVTENQFWPMNATGMQFGQDDQLAEAYQVTLTNTSEVTAEVTGFAVVFYSQGQELTSDNEPFTQPTFLTPGQSLAWTETPWGDYSNGSASVGPFASGQTGAVNSVATCSMVQWYRAPGS
jgi:hypothetical protein